MLNGASSITGASGSTASSSSESAPPPLPLLGPLTRALCSLPADRQHENLPAFQMELESGADEIEAEVEAHENTLLLSADILQPDRQPGGVDGKADPYIPQWSRASTKFLDLQAESRRRGGIAGVGIIEGPVTRLMRLPRSILHTAVAKSALRLSKKRMNKVASFAKTLCADQFRGAALKVPSVDTVKRHVSRACDRAVDEGVLRQATYHGEADWRRIASLRPAMLAGWLVVCVRSLCMRAAIQLLHRFLVYFKSCMPALGLVYLHSLSFVFFVVCFPAIHRQYHWTWLSNFRRTFLSPWTWCGMILGE